MATQFAQDCGKGCRHRRNTGKSSLRPRSSALIRAPRRRRSTQTSVAFTLASVYAMSMCLKVVALICLFLGLRVVEAQSTGRTLVLGGLPYFVPPTPVSALRDGHTLSIAAKIASDGLVPFSVIRLPHSLHPCKLYMAEIASSPALVVDHKTMQGLVQLSSICDHDSRRPATQRGHLSRLPANSKILPLLVRRGNLPSVPAAVASRNVTAVRAINACASGTVPVTTALHQCDTCAGPVHEEAPHL